MKFEVYADKRGEFRWRLKAANGKVLADSGESYTRRRRCVDAVARIKRALGVNGPFLWIAK